MASRERRPLDPLPVLPRDGEGWAVGPSVAAGKGTLSCLFRGAPGSPLTAGLAGNPITDEVSIGLARRILSLKVDLQI